MRRKEQNEKETPKELKLSAPKVKTDNCLTPNSKKLLRSGGSLYKYAIQILNISLKFSKI